MKVLYILFFALIFSSIAMSQPIITRGNLPQLGDSVIIAICSDIPTVGTLDAQTGENYSWDFSYLTESEEQYFNYVSPSSTYWANEYLNSNICGISWRDSYNFYNITANELTSEGNKVLVPPNDTATFFYTNQEKIIQIPYSMGTTFQDDFSGVGNIVGFEVTISGSVNFEADGYGSLVLPNATYQNVVRYRIRRTQMNSISGLPPQKQSKTQWAWVSADYRFWLLLIEEINDGFSNSYLTWYDKSPLSGVSSNVESQEIEEFSVYPNPASVNGLIRFTRTFKAGEIIQLYDIQGRLVKSFANISETNSISLYGLNIGVYQLKIINIQGKDILNQKLVII